MTDDHATDDYAELRHLHRPFDGPAIKPPGVDVICFACATAWPCSITALLADRDRLAEAAEDVSETLSRNNIDFSGLASQYPAVYYVGMAIQKLRAALRGSGAAEEAGRG